ncbi:MAG: helix-turn-helix domain-containing protein [Patescibacteria group bacterium]
MDRYLSKTLVLLGCSTPEIRFFLALFDLSLGTIPEIATTAKIRRSTAYTIAKSLQDKELIFEDHTGYAKKFHPIDPSRLLQLLATKQRQIRKQELELEENLPTLLSKYQSSQTRPKVKVFEGNTGLMRVWKDILSTQNEILLWTNQHTENQLFTSINHDRFITERLSKKIPIKVLAVDNPEGRSLLPLDSKSGRKTKILPKQTTFTTEMYIYDQKIAVLDYDKDIIGVIIESKPFSTTQKTIFELTWSTI